MEEDQERMMSLRSGRAKKSSVGIICCFTAQHRRRASFDAAAASYSSSAAPTSHPSPRGWFKSKNNTMEAPGKCRSFISRMGRHRRHASAEFSYDPLSYSLNFNDDADNNDSHGMMSFSARFSAMSSPHHHHSPRSPMYPRSDSDPRDTIRNKLSSPSPMATPEEVAKPVGISSNREILVQMC